MTDLPARPAHLPARPYFSSGPCAKPPGWTPANLATESLGRSHRSKIGKARLQYSIDLMRELLKLPATHRIGIVPGSDTARSKWRCGRCWAQSPSPRSPGKALAKAG